MLAGLRGADRVFGVHRIGQADVDDIDVGIVGDRIEIRVIVDVAGGEAVFGRDALGLGAIAAVEAGEAAVGAVREFGADAAEAVTAEPAHRITGRAALWLPGARGWAGKRRSGDPARRHPNSRTSRSAGKRMSTRDDRGGRSIN